MNGIYRILLIVTIASGTCITGAAQNEIDKDIDKLEKFIKSLDKDYVDPVITKTIVEDGIRRMLEDLDPHSVYLDADAYARSNEPLRGKFNGIGVRFIMVDDTMTILDVVPGGAAELGGMRTGDQIVRIGKDTVAGNKSSSSEISANIKTSEEDAVDILVLRRYPKREWLSLHLKKEDVEISSVPAYFMLENRTGYLKLERFSSTSLSDFRDGLDDLKDQRMKHLIIDLRGNGGGYLNVAIKIADEFLDDRKLIVYTEGEHQEKREVFATSGGRYTEGALYVLIDANSASASEILAGAIQDWDRGLIIGRRSYGKGLVQRTVEFSDGSAMRLTISRYYTPTGRSIQRSYEDGTVAYRRELRDRQISGELISADSIELIDSLVYFTPLQRKVYGGGGIVPDVFVPIDTSFSDVTINSIRRKALFQGFAFELYGQESEMLLDEYKDMEGFLSSYEMRAKDKMAFQVYLEKKDIELTDEQFAEHNIIIHQLISAPLARFLYGYKAYYKALAAYDNDIHFALQEIDRGTYHQLGLN